MPKNENVSKKAIARLLYFKYTDPDVIAEKAQVTRRTIGRWMSEWKPLRAKDFRALTETVAEQNGEAILKIQRISLNMVHNALVTRYNSGRPLSIQEAKILGELAINFQKLQRLEAGQPTEIVENQFPVVTIDDLRRAIEGDPFVEIVPMKKGITSDREREVKSVVAGVGEPPEGDLQPQETLRDPVDPGAQDRGGTECPFGSDRPSAEGKVDPG